MSIKMLGAVPCLAALAGLWAGQVGAQSADVISLSLTESDSTHYGYRWPGAEERRDHAEFLFDAPAGQAVTVSLRGYDVDFNDELRVSVNGSTLGFLAAGTDKSEKSTKDSFTVPANLLVASAGHRLLVEQVGGDGWMWGVTDVLVEVSGNFDPVTAPVEQPDEPTADVPAGPSVPSLAIGVTNNDSYGWKYAGAVEARESATFTFAGGTQSLILSVRGFDVDYRDEVEVTLNGRRLGYLPAGQNNRITATTRFTIPAADQHVTNILTFSQARRIGYIWGVTNLRLDEHDATALTSPDEPVSPVEPIGPVSSVVLVKLDESVESPTSSPSLYTLAVGTTDNTRYGWLYTGAVPAEAEAVFAFPGGTEPLVLSVQGYDIDYSNEVEVSLNGRSLGYLPTGLNNGLSSVVRFTIPAADQQADNRLAFSQARQIGYIWGVTALRLDTQGSATEPAEPTPPANTNIALVLDRLGTESYGWQFAGALSHRDDVTFSFDVAGIRSDLDIEVTGHDVDSADEIEVIFNGRIIGYVTTTANGATADCHDVFLLPAADVLATNLLTFRKSGGGDLRWGITELSVLSVYGS